MGSSASRYNACTVRSFIVGSGSGAQRRPAPDGLKMNYALMRFMTDDLMQTTLATWTARGLPARLDVTATAKLLGFTENDMRILLSVGKLTPLGDAAPNAPKWFAAVEIIRLATDQDWLHKATKEIAKFWKNKRERRVTTIVL